MSERPERIARADGAGRRPLVTLRDPDTGVSTAIWDGRRLPKLADGIAMLAEANGFCEKDQAKITIGPIRLPDGRNAATVAIVGPHSMAAMPTCGSFRALSTMGNTQGHPIAHLHNAIVDYGGNVTTTDGLHLHSVEFVRTYFRYTLTPIQEEIVYLTIQLLGKQDHCFKGIHESLLDLRILDYAVLPTLKLPSLKTIENFIQRNSTIKVSRHLIAKALADAGMRIPFKRSTKLRTRNARHISA